MLQVPESAMSLLRDILLEPGRIVGLRALDWDLLVRQARHANLLGRLYRRLEAAELLAQVPERARNHMQSAAVMAERQHLLVRHETRFLRDTLAKQGLPLILLKGAAYVVAGLPAARGRVFADMDILVPRERIGEVESALILTGWIGEKLDAYDQRYYREWMHELPAMQQMHRGTALDVHHTILPPTARLKPDAQSLIRDSVEVPGWPGVRMLQPTDMVLHSACHLFHEGESDNLLRDLSDLDLLLRHFSAEPQFWDALVARAAVMDLQGPLRLALRYLAQCLACPVPDTALLALRAERSRGLAEHALDFIYSRTLRPQHASTRDWATPLCRKLLYIRGHWLRMPPHLLFVHLVRKAWKGPTTVSASVLQKDAR
jgi:hypothetical protein